MNASRRSFLKTSSVAVLGFPAILRAASLNSNLQIAAVGASGKGLSDITEIGSHPKVKFVGLCDVDTSKFEQAARKHPDVPQFQDFHEMFAKLGDTFDAVIVSTPDHQHAIIGMAAMRLRKHLYCQKPLTHTVWEARQMRLQADHSQVITQMGNQIHSATQYRTAVKLVRDGVIGKIAAVHSWQNKAGNAYTKLSGELPKPGPVPETMNWDLWIGPAPMRDFAPDAYHPAKWRDWQDFGSGVLGDFGCHIMDPVFTALELKPPLSLRAENDGTNPQTWPVGETISYLFPGAPFTTGKTMPLTWYDGKHALPAELLAQLPADFKLPDAGSIFVGEGGLLLLPHVKAPQLFPVEKFAAYPIVEVPGTSHYHAWVDGAMAGTRTTDGFHYAGPLTEAVQLANVATRVPGLTLEWDPVAMKFPNHPEAERFLRKTYRQGWKLEPAG